MSFVDFVSRTAGHRRTRYSLKYGLRRVSDWPHCMGVNSSLFCNKDTLDIHNVYTFSYLHDLPSPAKWIFIALQKISQRCGPSKKSNFRSVYLWLSFLQLAGTQSVLSTVGQSSSSPLHWYQTWRANLRRNGFAPKLTANMRKSQWWSFSLVVATHAHYPVFRPYSYTFRMVSQASFLGTRSWMGPTVRCNIISDMMIDKYT